MMILNRDYMTDKTVLIKLNDSYRIYSVSKQDGLQYIESDSSDSICVSLPAGDATLIRLQKSIEEPFTIEYRLSK